MTYEAIDGMVFDTPEECAEYSKRFYPLHIGEKTTIRTINADYAIERIKELSKDEHPKAAIYSAEWIMDFLDAMAEEYEITANGGSK